MKASPVQLVVLSDLYRS